MIGISQPTKQLSQSIVAQSNIEIPSMVNSCGDLTKNMLYV